MQVMQKGVLMKLFVHNSVPAVVHISLVPSTQTQIGWAAGAGVTLTGTAITGVVISAGMHLDVT
jgi:hypothetical protein